mgnify:CR=1 FL=1
MTVPPLILGFDTSGPHCAAALLSGETVIAEQCETMVRGQAERLMPMMHDLLAGAGVGWSDLTALGVGTGPGNFTGLRIAVSAARGLALGLEIPAVGVTGCQARALLNPGQPCAIPAPRDQVYLCDLDDPRVTPIQMSRAEAETRAATAISAEASPPGLAAAIARVAAAHWQTTTEPPAPVYARAADAAPSRHTPPVLLD